jgi:hypothetical protein
MTKPALISSIVAIVALAFAPMLAFAQQGWIIFCPEENAQLGDVFYDSEQAFRLSRGHNESTGHHSSIQPYYGIVPASPAAPGFTTPDR